MADELPLIHVYLDEEIEADSIEDLRARAADLAEEAWRREVAFRVEQAARPPSAPFDSVVSAEAIEAWGKKLLAEAKRPWPFLGGSR